MRLMLITTILSTLLTAQEFPLTHPDDSPEDWMLAFIDVETTGLIPGYNEMIDIGVILADLEGVEIARTLIRTMPNHPERTAPEVPGMNGFAVDKWEGYGALTTAATVDSLVAFYAQHTDGRNVLMVAYNSQFDTAFLDHLFRTVDRSWRELHYYFVLDLPSMAWSLGMRDLWGNRLMEQLHIEKLPDSPDLHTGLRCSLGNIDIYRELLSYSRNR